MLNFIVSDRKKTNCPACFSAFFVGIVNSWIHTLMYVYYALAALGPEMQKYLWWKKYMTKLQLVRIDLVIFL